MTESEHQEPDYGQRGTAYSGQGYGQEGTNGADVPDDGIDYGQRGHGSPTHAPGKAADTAEFVDEGTPDSDPV